MKVYNVPLYRVSYYPSSYGKVTYIEDILVKKNLVGVSEVLTGYSKIDIVPKSSVMNGKLSTSYLKPERSDKNGYHLFTYSEVFVPKNRATELEVDDYLSYYEDSKWKEIYEGMKVMTIEEKSKVSQKVKGIFGSKK